MNRTILFAFLTTSSLMLLAPARARADQIFKVHGSLCQPSLAGRSNVNYNQWGISNASTSPVTVHCPMVSEMFESAPLVLQSITLTLYDRSTTDDIVCRVRIVTFFGAVVFDGEVRSSGGGPGSGPQTRGVITPDHDASTHAFVVSCVLPGAVGEARSVVTSIEASAALTF